MLNYNYTCINFFEDEYGWDESQLIGCISIQRVMGMLSLIGSSYVIQDVLRNEQKRNHTFHRLMVGLSISDVLSSFSAHILSTLPMPKGYQVFAVGNIATCDAQGVINVMCGYTTTLYNCSLATYYLVTLKYNWVNRRIKALEKWLHIIPWSVGLAFALVGLLFKLYGPHGFMCIATTIEYPFECTFPDSSIECIRGGIRSVIFSLTFLGFLFLAMCYISVTMFMVYRSVSNIEIQAHKYSFASFRLQKIDRKRSRRVMIQGVLYGLGLFLTYIFIIPNMFSNDESFVAIILSVTFWPLQGAFNVLIYSIPIFQRMYKQWKEKRKENQNLNRNGKSVLHNINKHNQSVTRIGDETIEEECGNKEFDREEEKEEIQRSNETSITDSKLPIDDNRFELKNSDIQQDSDVCDGEEMEGRETQGGGKYMMPFPYNSGNVRKSYLCDGEEMEGEETEGGGEYMTPFPYNSGNVRKSYQSEKSLEGGLNNDAGESEFNDDIDDYFAIYLW